MEASKEMNEQSSAPSAETLASTSGSTAVPSSESNASYLSSLAWRIWTGMCNGRLLLLPAIRFKNQIFEYL